MQYPSKMIGSLQRYSWGKAGSHSRIGQFARLRGEQGPLAEFWLGAHPKGPAHILRGGETTLPLPQAIADDPGRLLGACWQPGAPATLPFMLKVLSINEAFGLSIQAHPDKAVAKRLHIHDPENYPDDNHKPEMGIALTPTTILYGFKPMDGLLRVAKRYPELGTVMGYDLQSQITTAFAQGEEKGALMRELLARLYAAPTEVITTAVTQIAQHSQNRDTPTAEELIIQRLRHAYGDSDVGLLVLLFMNVVRMDPGEGICIGAGVPHAYLAGDVVECMACSDNVVRAGLTPKFRDDATLLEIADYGAEQPTLMRPALAPDGFMHYPPFCDEFRLAVAPTQSTPLTLTAQMVPSIALLLGKRAVVRRGREMEPVMELLDGEALFIPPGEGSFLLEREDAAVYHASAGAYCKQ